MVRRSGRLGTREAAFAVVGLSLFASGIVSGQHRSHDITADDYFSIAYVFASAPSPDGSAVAYVEGRWDESLDKRNNDLWVAEGDGALRRLTFDPASDGSPQWDASGTAVYFSSSRDRGEDVPPYDGTTQVWKVDRTGGPIVPVTRVVGGIDGYQLSGDGKVLYYATSTSTQEEDGWDSLRSEFGDLEYGHGVEPLSTLWALDLTTWRTKELVAPGSVIVEFEVAPAGNRLVMLTAPSAELISNEGWSEVEILDLNTGVVERLEHSLWRDDAPSPYGWIVEPAWSDDGNALAFRVDFDGYPGMIVSASFEDDRAVRLKVLERPDGSTKGEQVSAEGPMHFVPGTHDVVMLAEDHGLAHLYRLDGVSSPGAAHWHRWVGGERVVEDFGFSRDGSTLVTKIGTTEHTPDLFSSDVDFPERLSRLTDVNAHMSTWKLPQVEIVRWRSPDGTEVEGLLELPPDWTPDDGPLPLVVSIHGGPTASSRLQFRYWIYGRTIFAAKGWACFDPNYRGSTGYGDKFLTDLIGNKNNLDVADILSGVDALVERGIVDEDRMAVTGWSNGGYLTNCLIAATDRFKAASSGAGVFDTVMQWSIEDTPGHVINYSGGLPWEQAEKMHATSPLYDADAIRTPTIVHVGENDPRVPVEHSRALHRALHHYLDVPCQLVVYPGTGHGLTTYTHRKAKLHWDLAWFERYVLDVTEGSGTKPLRD